MCTCSCMAESLHSSPETTTTVNQLYLNTKEKVWKKNKKRERAASTWVDLENFTISEMSHIET